MSVLTRGTLLYTRVEATYEPAFDDQKRVVLPPTVMEWPTKSLAAMLQTHRANGTFSNVASSNDVDREMTEA